MVKKFIIFDRDSLENIHKRVFFSISVFVIFYFIAFFRITDIMILSESLILNSSFEPKIQRGKIFDRNGVLLASSIKSFSLAANSQEIQDDNCNYSISKNLESILNISKYQINKKLLNNKKFVYIKRNISPQEHQKIINLGEIGLRTEVKRKRIYPLREITSHVVGYTGIDEVGQGGIEKGLEKKLSAGEDIQISIDSRLQQLIRNELLKTINKFSADSAASIVLDIKTGEILSINSFPDFDPNNLNSTNLNNLFNRAIQGNYEMGSTFKPITMAIGLDKNIIDKNMSFDVTKPIKVGSYRINDFKPHKGELDVKGIIVKSSNIGTALISNKIGKNNQIEFFKKIGFFKKINFEIDEAAVPLGNKNNWGRLETMTIGYGHGFAITPMHLAKAYASIVNGGYLIEPTFIENQNKKLPKKIIKQETSNLIKQLLRAVILETDYTGPRAKVEGYELGGKSGTAELLDDKGKYKKNANRTTFVSVFPISDPKYLVLAMVENPKKIKEENFSITAATVAAPLVKNIIVEIIKVLNISPVMIDNSIQAYNQNFFDNKYVTF